MILLNSPLVLFLSLQQTIQTADSLALTEKAFFVLLKTRRSIFSLCLRATCFFSLSPFPKWHRRASHLILSSSSFTPSTCLPPTPLWHLSSSTSCTSPLPPFFLSKTTQVTLRKRRRSSCLRSLLCHLVQRRGFSLESHFWFLFNTEIQNVGAEGTTLCLKPSWFPWGTLYVYFTVIFFFFN